MTAHQQAPGNRERRTAELRELLETRRRALLETLHHRLREVRSEHDLNVGTGERLDGQAVDADVQEDIELALIQMKAETLSRIAESLARLDAGAYGVCVWCGGEIASSRLRALPFAIRCRDCEAEAEAERAAAPIHTRRWAAGLHESA